MSRILALSNPECFTDVVEQVVEVLAPQYGSARCVLLLEPNNAFARVALEAAPHAEWGAACGCLAVVYGSTYKHVVWHECLHLFGAEDCYDTSDPEGNPGPMCGQDGCIMQHGCFDAFFSTFVLYNFLYDYICQEDEGRFPETRDSERSVHVAPRFLGAGIIASDAKVREAAERIKFFVDEKAFYLRDDKWDAERVKGLEAADSEEWAKNLLQIIYRIRCNTFHGRKQFSEKQKLILVPCITILQRLNDLLMEGLTPSTHGRLTRESGTSSVPNDERAESGAPPVRRG